MDLPANPLLARTFAIPFDRIRPEHVEPAIEALIARASTAIEALKFAGQRTWANTMHPLDMATEPLERAWGIVGHLHAVAATPPLQDVYARLTPRVSLFFAGLNLDAELYAAVRDFAATDEAAALTGPPRRFLDKTLDEFRRNGAELSAAHKTRFEEITRELAEITTQYAQNVLATTTNWSLLITDEARLEGLPGSTRAMLRAAAEAKGQEGWRFTLQAPCVMATLTYAADAKLRQELWAGYNARGATAEHDNGPLIERILLLRREKAALLGYADFADYVLADRMAKSGESAVAFVNGLRDKAAGPFAAETDALRAYRHASDGGDTLEPWDTAYWSERCRKERFDFDEEQIRPYFSLESTVSGLFQLVHRLYGISVTAVDLPAWHESVRTFEIHDAAGTKLGAFYMDVFPRDTKRSGAWMQPLITGLPSDGAARAPHLGLICANMSPPVGGEDARLTHREVETLFHEFGHLLHHLLTEVEIRSLAGTQVAWDFVELPSQIMENWCWERAALDLFARHHETGEPLPEELFQKMTRARTYRAGSSMMRQLGFAEVDLEMHRSWTADSGPVLAYARQVMAPYSPVDLPEDYAFITSFGHLFADAVGYAAGYYSYKWAEVLEADAFSRFRTEGVFSPDVGDAFRQAILSRGNSDDPMALFQHFMGREPDAEALLRRSGLAG